MQEKASRQKLSRARFCMTCNEFYSRFGGSLIAKNLHLVPTEMGSMIKWIVKFLSGKKGPSLVNRTFYAFPSDSALPREFIRLDPWEAEYLFMVANRAKNGIVEIGRYHGGSTFLLACANMETPIYSIDLGPKNDQQVLTYMDENGLGKNVTLLVGDSQIGEYPKISNIDLLFIDGDHSYEGCTNDLNNWYPKVVEGGHVLLHDCYFGSEVQQSVLDFVDRHHVEVIRSPYIIASHWHSAPGSIAHMIKRG